MNVPNLLSLFRILITFFFILAVYHDRLGYALYLFILQGITDLLDGFIARVMSKKTNLGAFLDPIADKTMLVGAFVMLSIKGIVPVWLPALIVLKDLVVAVGFYLLYRRAFTIKPVPTIFGKITTTCQIATVLFILLVQYFLLVECRSLYRRLYFSDDLFYRAVRLPLCLCGDTDVARGAGQTIAHVISHTNTNPYSSI